MSLLIANPWLLGSLIPFLSFFLIAQQTSERKENGNCVGVQFIIEEQPDAPAQLTVKETSCKTPHSMNVELSFKNTSAKIIKEYRVEHIDTYEYMKGSRTVRGVRGPEIEPGESIKVLVGGGYKDGLSYGKPVGELLKVVFRIKYIGFKDGEAWEQPELNKSKG